MKFRKRPVVIEAWDTHQLMIDAKSNWYGLPEAIRNAYERGDVIFARDHVVIKTLEGDHRAESSDKVIQGVKGELYPCKPDIFEATYEALSKGPSIAEIDCDGPCLDCSQPCLPWFADNESWNRVIPERSGLLCPNCFIKRAERIGLKTFWQLSPDPLLADEAYKAGEAGGEQ